MQIRWLGWAGVELGCDGITVVIDALADPAAVFAPLGVEVHAPAVVPPAGGTAVAALVTHLHRDHADAEAIAAALAPGGIVYEPEAGGGEGLENLALAQAEHELAAAGLERRRLRPWDRVEAGPFTVTALPAVDGTGDPQVSWLVEAGGTKVVHLGDTLFHGAWWRMAERCGPFDVVCLPVNGPVVSFPHRRPPSPFAIAMEPEQAAVAAELLGARLAIPVHAHGYGSDGLYDPVPDAVDRFAAAAAARGLDVHVPYLGEVLEPVG